ncbi:MAG: oxygen-independent coproporphyrinogen III oxidase [Flavobacteriia bacterium]|nr:oxygen-independent coproporphyrinogen III oxidase [Flavobacteriia bacterium]
MSDKKILIQKYNVPGPRYTSYPTVPFWKNDQLSQKEWIETIERNRNAFQSNEISVYIHLPFCESLCTFCGCHKRITKNHSVEEPYIDTLIKEWKIYRSLLNFKPTIKEFHFGGGTPTFFKASELKRLLVALFEAENIDSKEHELSFEAHPNNTTEDHLKTLFDFGFRRLSLGIQDYSPNVQKAIHRFQPFENVQIVHELAKEIGYTSISHDLVFGLPKQHLKDILSTIEKTLLLMPDRISLYSYAHVPWIKGNGQRGYNESDLPKNEEKRILYEQSKEFLEKAGYIEVGMDHFALKHDDLAKAMQSKKLHRNFMGYTTQSTSMMIGLGMSSISDSWYGFAQNDKSVEEYTQIVNEGKLPVFRGHILTEEDLLIRRHILNLMCHFETEIDKNSIIQSLFPIIKSRLAEMIKDGLVNIEGQKVKITEIGIPFVRNCCMAFDQDLNKQEIRENLFSKTI